MTAVEIARALGGARRHGAEWDARCPAHDDASPSLSLRDGDGGKILFRCHAGCSQQQVFDALCARGLLKRKPAHENGKGDDWHSIFPPPVEVREPVELLNTLGHDVLYPYCSPDGRIGAYVARFEARNGTRKWFQPLTYGVLNGVTGWHRKAITDHRPLYHLDQLAARPDAKVLVCEGEKSADAAAKLFPDYVCTTWQGGSGTVAKADRSPLATRSAIIWPDNDGAGRKAGAEIHHRLPHAHVLRVDELPPGGDAHDLKTDDPDRWLDEHLIQADPTNGEGAARFFDPWADPPPPEFPGGVLTREMEDTIFALALRDGVCPGALAMAYLTAASGAAHKAARFFPYQNGDWSVPPITWVMEIADSGQRKTEIENRAFVPLREAHAAIWRAHRRRHQKWQALPTDERRKVPKPEEPHSFLVEDVTPEKLQIILAATDRGTFMARDEMAGLFEFGRYGKNTGAAERAFYLQAYEGGPYTVSRVGRDSLHIEINALSIYGSIQPDRLKDFPDLAKDGLIQRINMVRASPAAASRDNVTVKGVDKINTAILNLTRHEARRYRTTPDGSNIIRQTERDGRDFATFADYGPGFQGTCSKLHGTHARWTLVLHLLDDPDSELIPQTTVERAAILICGFLLPQARDFFANLAGSPQLRLRDAAGWILTRAPVRFLASDLTAGVWACRGISTKELGELLDPLVTGGWIEPEVPFPSNRAWIINPNLRAAFAARAATESARREEAHRLILRLGKPYAGTQS